MVSYCILQYDGVHENHMFFKLIYKSTIYMLNIHTLAGAINQLNRLVMLARVKAHNGLSQ